MLMTTRKPATAGEILIEEFMEPMGLTQEAMGVARKHVNELCNDRRTVTAPTALILARVFGNSPEFLAERAAAHRFVGNDAFARRAQGSPLSELGAHISDRSRHMNASANRSRETGSVLGVDIGFSRTRRSSAACRLDWNFTTVDFSIERFRASEPERSQVLRRVADRPILAAAFDGPLRSDLELIGRYRIAEQILTRQLQPFIGKPGQSSAPIGKCLNFHANACAKAVLGIGVVDEASHDHAIHDSAIVEAFPSSFLGLLIEAPLSLKVRRGDRSDTFYDHLARSGGLLKLPGRRPDKPFRAVVNHDDRAAVVCALTALCVVAGDYTVVGNEDGWIVLPPPSLIQSWAWKKLNENAQEGGLEWRGGSPIHQLC